MTAIAFIIGNLGKDAELKTSVTGKPYTTFGVAVSVKGTSGEKETQWHQILIFDKMAESLVPFLKKGKKVFVEADIRVTVDKERKLRTTYMAKNLQLLSPKEEQKEEMPMADLIPDDQAPF